MENTVTLRISRSAYIERDLSVAFIRLDSFTHIVGQPVQVRYYKSDGSVDAITVIGIKNGVGRNCYSIISTSGLSIVNGIFERLPDVSELVNGAYYLCKVDSEWCITYIDGVNRKLDKNIGENTSYLDISTGRVWFYRDGEFRREDDFLSSKETTDLMVDAVYTSNPVDLRVVPQDITILSAGNKILNPSFKIEAINYEGKDILDQCVLKISSLSQGEVAIKTTDPTTKIYTTFGNIVSDDVFTIEVSFDTGYSVKKYKKQISYRYIDPTYYGHVPSDYTLSELMSLDSVLFDKEEKELELEFNLNENVSVVAIPASQNRFEHIYDEHGFDYIDNYTTEIIRLFGLDYTLYVKKDEVTIKNFKQKFIR